MAEVDVAAEEEVIEKEIEEVVDAEVEESSDISDELKPEETEEEELVVSFDEDSPTQKEKDDDDSSKDGWLSKERKKFSAANKENRELKERLAQYEQKDAVVLGDKPTFESCGFDSAKFDTDTAAWYDRKALVEKDQAVEKEIAATQEKAWQTTLDSYGEKATELKAKVGGFNEAETLVKESFSTLQQSIILKQAKNPAHFILALGKDPKTLEKLSSIEDPATFLWEAAQMETRMKVTGRKAATSPEKKVESGGGSANMGDAALEKLEKEAAKTGDRTKVLDYKRSKRK